MSAVRLLVELSGPDSEGFYLARIVVGAVGTPYYHRRLPVLAIKDAVSAEPIWSYLAQYGEVVLTLLTLNDMRPKTGTPVGSDGP